jgi:RimJ/RimL family protein N-acetyltransferase
MRIELRPTVPADLQHVIAVPLPHRIRAITALAGDRVLGVGGIGYRPDGTVIAFVAMNDEARKYPAAVHRAGRMAMRMIRETGLSRVLAEAEADNPAAERWLERLGFRKTEIAGQTAFVWERGADVE